MATTRAPLSALNGRRSAAATDVLGPRKEKVALPPSEAAPPPPRDLPPTEAAPPPQDDDMAARIASLKARVEQARQLSRQLSAGGEAAPGREVELQVAVDDYEAQDDYDEAGLCGCGGGGGPVVRVAVGRAPAVLLEVEAATEAAALRGELGEAREDARRWKRAAALAEAERSAATAARAAATATIEALRFELDARVAREAALEAAAAARTSAAIERSARARAAAAAKLAASEASHAADTAAFRAGMAELARSKGDLQAVVGRLYKRRQTRTRGRGSPAK